MSMPFLVRYGNMFGDSKYANDEAVLQLLAVLNWDDAPQDVSVRLKRRCRITDFWSEAALGIHSEKFEIRNMPARSGRLLVCATDFTNYTGDFQIRVHPRNPRLKKSCAQARFARNSPG
jgi:hypothetical protein